MMTVPVLSCAPARLPQAPVILIVTGACNSQISHAALQIPA
jgi:hypothetical protein